MVTLRGAGLFFLQFKLTHKTKLFLVLTCFLRLRFSNTLQTSATPPVLFQVNEQ